MLVHVWHNFERNLYLFEGVSDDFVISSTSFVGTGVGSAGRFLDELGQSLRHVLVSFLFWCASHLALNVRNHEEQQRHYQKNRDCAKQTINDIFLLRILVLFINSEPIICNDCLIFVSQFLESRVPITTHVVISLNNKNYDNLLALIILSV